MAALPPGTDLSQIPFAPNPSGAPPNFVDPPTLHHAHEVSGLVLVVISSIVLLCRLGTNLSLVRRLNLDDYLCILAQVTGIAYWVLTHLISERGSSRHTWDIPLSLITVPFIKLTVSIQIVIAPCLWAAKSAILALYVRVFGTIRWFRITCYSWIVLMGLFYAVNIVIACVYCLPRRGERWDGTSLQRCNESAWSAIFLGVFSVVADLVILVLPFPILRRLHMSLKKKLGLAATFSTGVVLVALSIASLVLRVRIFSGVDSTWNGTLLQMVTMGEIFGTVMVACAPAISAFWFKIVTKSTIWSQIQVSAIFSSRKTNESDIALSIPRRLGSTTNSHKPSYEVHVKGPDQNPACGEARLSINNTIR